ncbi:MAG: O-antigen ligase family protein [Anaerolineales bacterium]|nr:O-antigen ligase family protein [Anaerolineales bacterium]
MRRWAAAVGRWEWAILLLLLPLLLLPAGVTSLALLLLPLLWGVQWLGGGMPFPRTPYRLALLLLAVMMLASLAAVFDIGLSFPKLAGLVMGIALFGGAVRFGRRQARGLTYLAGFFLLGGAGMALVGLLGTEWMGPFTGLNRLRGVLPAAVSTIPGTLNGVINPNELAGVLNWVAPVSVALTLLLAREMVGRRRWVWLLLAGMSLLTTGILVATLSRGGILSLGISLMVMLAVQTRWGRWLLLLAAVGGIILAFQLNLFTLFAGDPQAGGATLGLDGRLEIWSRALYGLQDFPFTGMSMNGFRRVVHVLYPLFLISPDVDIVHAHNHLLQAGLDLGLPGLVAYLALWWISGVLLWQTWRRVEDPWSRALALGLIGALAGGWSFGMLDAITLGARPGFMWWLLLAMVVLLHERVMAAAKVGGIRP